MFTFHHVYMQLCENAADARRRRKTASVLPSMPDDIPPFTFADMRISVRISLRLLYHVFPALSHAILRNRYFLGVNGSVIARKSGARPTQNAKAAAFLCARPRCSIWGRRGEYWMRGRRARFLCLLIPVVLLYFLSFPGMRLSDIRSVNPGSFFRHHRNFLIK